MRRLPVALGLLTVALFALAPAAPVMAREEPLKAGSVLHLKSKKHDHPFSLYVPSNYSPRVSWPVVISSHGRGGSGKGEIGQWTGLAKSGGFIVACPDMCTATVNRPPNSTLRPEVEDDEVIMSIFEEICANFRVNRRAVMITGFSGGGNPSYYTGLGHPDVFTHIATRGGNFAPQQVPRDEATRKAGLSRIRIYIYYGEFDHPIILGNDGEPGHAQAAFDALTKAGYEHIKYEKIAAMKHQSRADLAAKWFGEYLKENRKRFLAGDKADGMTAEIREKIDREKYKDAVRTLLKLMTHEEKTGLNPDSAKLAAELTEIANEMLGQARSTGDPAEAKKLASRVARDFRGLPVADEAKALTKELAE